MVAIVGPTGTGKTDVAIELAKMIGGEIVSADSMQVYRYLDIGTAKATPQQRAEVPHHLIDIVDPDEDYSVTRFQEDAQRAIGEILARGRTPIVVGGTGFYVRAVLGGLRFPPVPPQWELRKRLQKEAEERGAEFLHERLRQVDPVSAARIHPRNVKRVMRALEVFEVTGKPVSAHRVHRLDAPSQIKYNPVVFGLTMQRERLYRRLDARVDAMLAAGFLDELRGLLQRGYDERLPPLQGLGYRQMLAYLRGEMEFEQAVMLWKRDTRRYAKRQWTWFRREPDVRWVDVEAFPNARAIAQHLQDVIAAEQHSC
ncbi:MAG: tRNA (adenosine(37)-N6)-dimethylallyltransferase MiaA [Abditibacteriales bacterium]|nr:tRNA (adenosine(37)-N6)-dimethylallyltransferase MiaA [Abditibacteriales bacterium]MDW8365859.1 tRNA (adenosine(37)-N6)-dimethylallyltransferase MiaA [Abditibacteriales bacterium]